MSAVRITTVIATYNAEKWIDSCLTSLKSSILFTTIIVVDNCSNDNTVRIIREKYPEVTLIKSTKNLGFGKANNLGIEAALAANPDYIFLLNQDAWILPNTLEELVACSQRNPDALVVSPVHQNSEVKGIETGFKSYLNQNERDLLAQKKDVKVPFINAAIWLLPVKSIKIIGGFNPIFPHYGEDYNYCKRVNYFNYEVIICGNSIAFHERPIRNRNKNLQSINLVDSLIKLTDPFSDITRKNIENYSKIILKSGIKEIVTLHFKRGVKTLKTYQSVRQLETQILNLNRISMKKNRYSFLNINSKPDQ